MDQAAAPAALSSRLGFVRSHDTQDNGVDRRSRVGGDDLSQVRVERVGGFLHTKKRKQAPVKYYIATKLENHSQHKEARKILDALGHTITHDWTHRGAVYMQGLERIREVAKVETDGVLSADFIVVLWPGGMGTHVEMGIAIGAHKPIIFVSDNEAHHEATTETCAFYHHPLVRRIKNLSQLVGMGYADFDPRRDHSVEGVEQKVVDTSGGAGVEGCAC